MKYDSPIMTDTNTATFKTGDVVALRPERCETNEIGLRFVVVEWNGDRGFIVPKESSLPFPGKELVRETDITRVD